jgi:undecaprenyl-diphosphatase
MDVSLTHGFNSFLAAHDAIEDPLTAYVGAAELLFLLMLVLALLHPRLRRAAAAAGLSAGLGLAVAYVIAHLVDRPRPFVAHPEAIHLFLRHAADPGFPSDHTTAAFAIGVALLLRHRAWGVVVLVAAALLAIGRVGLGIHYPTDVLAGAVLGTLAALLLYVPLLRRTIDRLADLCGRPVDAALQGIVQRQERRPV